MDTLNKDWDNEADAKWDSLKDDKKIRDSYVAKILFLEKQKGKSFKTIAGLRRIIES